jgi:hypothetical protein
MDIRLSKIQSENTARTVRLFIVVLLGLAPALAQKPVIVDVALFPPTVMETSAHEGGFEGFDIELWQ